LEQVKQLNRALGVLGYVRGGLLPRFCWMWAPDIPYWSTRLDKVYVLCQWQRPEMSEWEWNRHFAGRHPYPANGMYHPFSETAIPASSLTEELNQNYIRVLDLQMSRSFAAHLSEVNAEVEKDREDDQTRWTEYVQDMNPAFGNFAPGTRGGFLSFGGTKTC
jgi:hypothetical protein